ncbi:unnamed protein product [Polarella glacialis]|uniref:RRM domain-containing protein n=1 Tax=Polarella glacialis TaxID=89957 RepID=A0A813FIW9_POLGL|nr:unnamed protein product [Polarella glacialis]
MFGQTNSIVAPLPEGMDLEAARLAFADFGEVHSLDLVPGFSSLAAVVFSNSRAASAALEAFGAAESLPGPGPQVGDRTVELVGDADLNMKDSSRISDDWQADPEVSASAWNEAGLRAKVEKRGLGSNRPELPAGFGSAGGGSGRGRSRQARARRAALEQEAAS